MERLFYLCAAFMLNSPVATSPAEAKNTCANQQWELFMSIHLGMRNELWQRLYYNRSTGWLEPNPSYQVTVTCNLLGPQLAQFVNYYPPGLENKFDKGKVVNGRFRATYDLLSFDNFTETSRGAIKIWANETYVSASSENLTSTGRSWMLEMTILGATNDERRRVVGIYIMGAGELTLFQVVMMWDPGNVTLAEYRAADYGATGPVELVDSWKISSQYSEKEPRMQFTRNCSKLSVTRPQMPLPSYQLPGGIDLWIPPRISLDATVELGIGWQMSSNQYRRSVLIYKAGQFQHAAYDKLMPPRQEAISTSPEWLASHLLLVCLFFHSIVGPA